MEALVISVSFWSRRRVLLTGHNRVQGRLDGASPAETWL